jgi:hypothetical protein
MEPKLSCTRKLQRINLVCNLTPADKKVTDLSCIEHLQATWCSPIYGFFKSELKISYKDGRKYHFFRCAANRCKANTKGV